MPQVIKATYKNGILEPHEALQLDENRQVVVILVDSDEIEKENLSDNTRSDLLDIYVRGWLAKIPEDAVRPPIESGETADELGGTLSEIWAKNTDVDEEQLVADIEEALTEIRSTPPVDKKVQEFDSLLADAK